MVVIPMKWMPYFLIVLGVFGTIVVAMKAEGGDRVFGIIVCVLAAVGGAVWLVIKAKRKK